MNWLFYLSLVGSLFTAQSYKPVDTLNLSQYDGLWYEIYGDRADRAFQGFGTCITAEYTIENENNVSVFNREIRKDGTVDTIEGYAFYEDNCTGGDLTVYLEGTASTAPYWVLELGPVVNDEYDYAIVSDDKQFTLFVLVRNVTNFFELYNDDVMDTLVEMGFTKKINEPMLIEQYTECVYSDDDSDVYVDDNVVEEEEDVTKEEEEEEDVTEEERE